MDDVKKKFSEIYDGHVEKIYRYVFLRVNSQETAEDLTSETFLKCWEVFRAEDKDIKNPRAFLYKIAKNLITDHYRRKGRIQITSIEFNNQLADPKINLEKSAVLASDTEMVKKAIAGLNEDYQNAIIWRYLDDLSIKEVATLLGRSEEATRVLIHRAIKELKTKMA